MNNGSTFKIELFMNTLIKYDNVTRVPIFDMVFLRKALGPSI